MKIINMKTAITTILLSFLMITGVNAQKYGHINSNAIIAAFPEVKTADATLESYSTQLIEKGQSMMKDYETSYQAYMTKANGGEISQLQMQQEETKLGQKQQEIQQYEVEVKDLVAKKKQEVYQPILDKIQVAINEVGKENGYTMIFDAGSTGMVFALETEDIMALVKTKLGI